ncbi:MAG: tryptophan synthase subunit alpha [Chloroflexota bacterium]|nr:tryptophan synthase subunit alpha [Chloroflexota bacterium]
MAIVIYLMTGFPRRDATRGLVRAALDGGADVIELGVPFSDPMADGTTVQHAGETALREGIRLDDCIAEARTAVAERDATVVLMGYLNPFLRYGPQRLADALRSAGVAGVIAPDLPVEESAEIDAALMPAGAARIDMFAPTTPDGRLERLLPRARGFVYCVSLTGVTGARAGLSEEVGPFVRRVRARTPLPIVVGFGISRPEHVRALRGVADGVAVGSAAIDAIDHAERGRSEEALRDLVRSLREAGAA